MIREVDRAAYLFGLPTIDLYKILRDFALDPRVSGVRRAADNTTAKSCVYKYVTPEIR